MPGVSEDQVKLPISNYPLGQIIRHESSPDVRFRVKSYNVDDTTGEIKTVVIQIIGGGLNRGEATVDADNQTYVAVGNKLRGRMRARAAIAKRAAAQPPAAVTTEPKKPQPRTVDRSQAPKATKETAPKPPKAPKPAKGMGTKSKGKHYRSKPSVPITDLKLDPRNPFDHGSRIHAYFQAMLDNKGRASYGQMVTRCLELTEAYGVTDDNEDLIRRDLNNQTHQWQKGKWGLTVSRDDSKCQKGKGGRLAKGEHDRVVFACTMVGDKPYAEHVASKRR